MSEFLAMGGYAWYVWMAYGATALAVGIEIAAVRARRRRAFAELRMSAEPTLRSPSLLRPKGSR
jgi:heme exporter protein D